MPRIAIRTFFEGILRSSRELFPGLIDVNLKAYLLYEVFLQTGKLRVSRESIGGEIGCRGYQCTLSPFGISGSGAWSAGMLGAESIQAGVVDAAHLTLFFKISLTWSLWYIGYVSWPGRK